MRLFRRRPGVALRPVEALGSVEHYYHFMWGYLLPALDLILTQKLRGPIWMRPCGPIMAPKLAEAGQIFGLDLRIAPDDVVDPRAEVIAVPHLDLRILCAPRGPISDPAHPLHRRLRRLPETDPALFGQLCDPAAIASLPGELRTLRDRVLPTLLRAARARPPAPCLVMRRAPQHEYYGPEGPARAKGYGAGRRSLDGLDAAVETLLGQGYPVQAYDCGAHSIADQAAAFSRAKGLAMIRGAEATNLIWCAPGTPVLILLPPDLVATPPHETLAAAADLRLTALPADSVHPVLDPRDVAAAWGPPPAPR